MNALGHHLLLELENCNRETLNDLDMLREILIDAAIRSGATVMGDSFHRFEPQGVSGFVVIAESHVSIHTWPEYGYAAVDIFTCGTTVIPHVAATIIIEKLEAAKHAIRDIQRGMLDSVEAGQTV